MKLKYNTWVRVMYELFIKDNISKTDIMKKVDCTYSHTLAVVRKLKENDLISISVIGRRSVIDLTKKGKEVAELCYKLLKVIE